MDIVVVRADCVEHATPLLAAHLFEGDTELEGPLGKLDALLDGQLSGVVKRGDFSGKDGQTLLLYPARSDVPMERILLVGVGKRDTVDLERLRRGGATVVKQAVKLKVERASTIMQHVELVADRITPGAAARAIAEGAVLGGYVFEEFKSPEGNGAERSRLDTFEILEKVAEKAEEIERGSRVGSALARGENLARTLGNLPGNVATPTYLGEKAREIAKETGLRATILGPDELRKEGLELLLSVSRGSDQEPRLIVLEHRKGKPDEKPLVLLGKGLTFDSGGISIKPSQGMEEMKFDMCGGAAVLGAMQAIGELDPPVNVIGVVPASENLPSGSALKPGDIVRSHLGKTVEVVNTDAEGRLILADALSYLGRFEPAAVVDAATLTGACVIALGHHATAGLGNDEALLDEVRAAGDRVGERVWPLPMFDEYREQIRSDYADIKNSGGRAAGTITAAWFLREFVGDFPWVHLDVAGTASGDGKLVYQTKGATGVPTRLFVEWVLSRAG